MDWNTRAVIRVPYVFANPPPRAATVDNNILSIRTGRRPYAFISGVHRNGARPRKRTWTATKYVAVWGGISNSSATAWVPGIRMALVKPGPRACNPHCRRMMCLRSHDQSCIVVNYLSISGPCSRDLPWEDSPLPAPGTETSPGFQYCLLWSCCGWHQTRTREIKAVAILLSQNGRTESTLRAEDR